MLQKGDWLNIYSQKICPVLQKKIGDTYCHHKFVPAFLHKPLIALKQILTKQRVIVKLKEDQNFTVLRAGNPKQLFGLKVKEELELINGFATKLNIKKIKQLVSSKAIEGVWIDREVKALLDVATPVTQAPKVWKHGLEGNGIGIAILDTGVYRHPDLTLPKNRLIAFEDFVKGRIKPYDDNGHGTHCAGDAAGNGYKSGGKISGAAPKANIIGVKVLDKRGAGYSSKVIAGIQWCIKNRDRYNIKVLSLSLGVRGDRSYKDDPLCQSVSKAWQAGLIVCAAAGNEGPAPGTISSPGITPEIITVGATDDRNTRKTTDDQVAEFSSRGPTPDGFNKPDLVVPGTNIRSLRAPRSYLDRVYPKKRVNRWYTTMSGTSMATPLCAGIAALILEGSPNLSPTQIKNSLMISCRDLGVGPNLQGAGLANALAAERASRVKST